ncbi:putative Pollike protein [Globisporangium polare]
MTVHNQRVDDTQIKSFVKYGKHLRKILLPVFEDLQFRLAFRLLPVRARFWFLEASNPRIQYCVRDGCDAIETEEHLFFECTLAAQLWGRLNQLVLPFFRARPTWLDIALATKMRVRDEWADCEEVVCDAWHTLRAVALHFIWSDRNRCLFDGRQPTPAIPALSVIFTTFSAHVRYFQRRLYEQDEKQASQRVISAMKPSATFGDFVTCNHGLLHGREVYRECCASDF